MALTGIIRYDWPLVRPLMAYLLETQLRQFDVASGVEVGPARPVLQDGETLDVLIFRLRGYLEGFDGAPWTAQRLAELLLEPGKQYKQLHKLALALEKLLLVSGSVPTTAEPPQPPLLSDLRPVNDNPPRVGPPGGGAAGGGEGAKRRREDGEAGMGLVSAALTVRGGGGEAAAAAAAGPTGDGSDAPGGAADQGEIGDGGVEAKRTRGEQQRGGEEAAAAQTARGGDDAERQQQQQQQEEVQQQGGNGPLPS